MIRQKWDFHRNLIRIDGLFAILIHTLVLLLVILVVHVNWKMITIYEFILVLTQIAIVKRTLPERSFRSIWIRLMVWVSSGVPWVLSIWFSQMIESFQYRSVLNQKIPLSRAKVPPSFYSSYKSNVASQFLYTALLQSIDIEFQGEFISVRNYGTIVYENELYAVFIPERENTLCIARLHREKETLDIPSKEIYHLLFDVLQNEK